MSRTRRRTRELDLAALHRSGREKRGLRRGWSPAFGSRPSSEGESEDEDEDEDEGGGIHDGEEYGERDDSVHAMMGSEAGNANDIGDNSEPIQTTMMLCHRCSIFTTYDPRFPTPLQRRDKFGLQRGLRDQKLMQTPGY